MLTNCQIFVNINNFLFVKDHKCLNIEDYDPKNLICTILIVILSILFSINEIIINPFSTTSTMCDISTNRDEKLIKFLFFFFVVKTTLVDFASVHYCVIVDQFTAL